MVSSSVCSSPLRRRFAAIRIIIVMDNLQPQPPHHLTPALAACTLFCTAHCPDCDTSLLMLVLYCPAYSRIDVQYRLHLELPALSASSPPPSRPLSCDAFPLCLLPRHSLAHSLCSCPGGCMGTALVGGECCQGVWKRSTDQRGFCSTDKREISSISSIRLDQRATDTRNDRLGGRIREELVTWSPDLTENK